MEDLIIVGAGPIGLYSASLARLHNLKGIVFESLDTVGGQLSEIYPEKAIIDLPGFASITAQGFIDKLIEQYDSIENPLPIKTGERVISFEKKEDYYVVTTNRETYETKTLLFTTGMGVFTPRKIGLESEAKFSNIIYAVKSKDSLKGQDVVILGGGNSAVDWAITLVDLAKSVSIVHRRDEFRAQSSSVDTMEKLGVNIYKPYNVKELVGKDDKLESIVLKSVNEGEEDVTVKVDTLVVNYGSVTAKQDFPMDMKNGDIIVNRVNMSSCESVFAIGNACIYEGKVKNITSGLGEAVTVITAIDQIIHPGKNIPIHF